MHFDRSGQHIISNVRTIHARSDFSRQITDETVLYLNEDKKETRSWFQACGNLNVPLGGIKYGLIRTISFVSEKVNHQNSTEVKASREADEAEILRKQNAALRKQLEHWKNQTKLTEERELRPDDVRKVLKQLISSYSARLSTEEKAAVERSLREIGNAVRYGQLSLGTAKDRMAAEVAGPLVRSASALKNSETVEQYGEIRKRLLEPMTLAAEAVPDVVPRSEWNSWRKAHRGEVNVSINGKGTGVDVRYEELSKTAPELFPESITHPADQLKQMVEVAQTLAPVYENPYDRYMAEAIEYAANDALERIGSEDVRAVPLTYADRQMHNRREAEKELEKKMEERLRRVREDREEKINAIREHYTEAARFRAEQRSRAADNQKLLRLIRRLRNRKMPQVSRAYLNSIIGNFDTFTVSLLGKKFRKLEQLADSYSEMIINNPNYIRDERIEEKLKGLERRHVDELTPEEMADLLEVLSAFEHKLINDRKLIDQQDRRDAYVMGQQIIADVGESRGSRPGSVTAQAVRDTLSPLRLVRRLTGWNDSDPLYRATLSLAEGQRSMLDYQRRAWERFRAYAGDPGFARKIAGKHAEAVELKGWRSVVSDRKSGSVTAEEPVTLRITPAMRMSLYLHSLNPQNLRHMRDGGVTVPDFDLYRKGRLNDAYDRGQTVKLLPADLRALARGMSDPERAFAEAARNYFSGASKEALNQTSLKLLGYEIAAVEEYFPIETNKDFLRGAEWGKMSDEGTIEGMGSLKERVTGASGPIMLRDLTDVLLTSIEQHSRYYGLAVPVRNFNKLMGVITGSKKADGGWNGSENSVLNAIRSKWGGGEVRYLQKLLTDIQSRGGGSGEGLGRALDRLRSNYAGGVLEMNAGVAVKQAASYPTAGAVVSGEALAKGLRRALALRGAEQLRALERRIDTYSPLLWHRSQGFRETELGDMAKQRPGLPRALQWITGMDVATTRALWLAAEAEAVRLNPELAKNMEQWRGTAEQVRAGESPYYKAVAEIYNRIIEETQPNYTVMQRPQALRSDNPLERALHSFKTQPYQNFNILYDALGNYAAKRQAFRTVQNEETRTALEEAKKGAARAVVSQLVSSFVFALMQYSWDLFRGKDDKYRDRDGDPDIFAWLKGMGINMASNAAGIVPLGGVAFELMGAAVDDVAKILGYDPVFDLYASGLDISFLGAVNDARDAAVSGIAAVATAVRDAADPDRDVDGEALARKVYAAAETLAQAEGLPAANVRKLMQAVA